MDREPDAIVLAPAELDVLSVDVFAELLAQTEPDAVVHVDCSQVTFVDSSGLRVLVIARNRLTAANGDLFVVAPTPITRRVLAGADLDALVHPADRNHT